MHETLIRFFSFEPSAARATFNLSRRMTDEKIETKSCSSDLNLVFLIDSSIYTFTYKPR